MKSYYYTTKLKKMGTWALLPADLDSWHDEPTSRYFKKLFGFGKQLLNIITLYDGGFEHAYVPESYFKKLYSFIRTSTAKDYTSLTRRLKRFYSLRDRLKKNIPKPSAHEIAKMTSKELIKFYTKNRDWVHQATVFDQFGWIAEEYWSLPMQEFLVQKCGIPLASPEYHRVLFALIKPYEISTTLQEKRAVLEYALGIHNKKTTLKAASMELSGLYGWVSVSAYGEPWGEEHYQQELSELLQKPTAYLQQEYLALKDYEVLRNKDIADIVKKSQISPRDLQLFIDFGLILDTRNEAEYLVSYCGYYLLPLYQEISKRLGLSIRQVRLLYEHEIASALKGTLDYQAVLTQRRRICGYGFDRSMVKRIYFTPQEAEKLFKHIEKNVKLVNQGADANKGLCASPGRVVGRVKIVHAPHENNKVEKGDIMIAVATMVDHLPAMKNAGAIVTEVGGLTCHAAVVSREFGIPCIVGLKDAMKKFNDGDRVEVDAGKGTVRKV